MRTVLFAATAIILSTQFASTAHSSTVLTVSNATFNTDCWYQADWCSSYPVSVDGFKMQTSAVWEDFSVLAYLHDEDIGLRSTPIWHGGGMRFDALEATVSGYTHTYTSPDGERFIRQDYENFSVFGWRDGSIVAGTSLSLSEGKTANLTFGDAFANLDFLQIRLNRPQDYVIAGWGYGEIPIDTFFCWEWCGGVQLSSLTVRLGTERADLSALPVPLPASALLLGSGLLLGAIGTARRRRIGRR